MLLFPFEQRGNVIDTLPLAYVSFWHRMARPGLHCIWTLEVGDRDGAMYRVPYTSCMRVPWLPEEV